jgi:NAD(P)-dependent dehydrogenase (short-subunit alcohol dehydrogenase family)
MSEAIEDAPIATYPSLKGKVVIVTGGGSGIGAAITRRFAEQGAKTAFIDIAEEASRALVAKWAGDGRDLHFERADLKSTDDLRTAVTAIRNRFGPIDILVNNAAHDERHALADLTPEYFDDRIAINLKHQFFMSQAVLPDMVAKKKGVIINFGSTSWLAMAACRLTKRPKRPSSASRDQLLAPMASTTCAVSPLRRDGS